MQVGSPRRVAKIPLSKNGPPGALIMYESIVHDARPIQLVELRVSEKQNICERGQKPPRIAGAAGQPDNPLADNTLNAYALAWIRRSCGNAAVRGAGTYGNYMGSAFAEQANRIVSRQQFSIPHTHYRIDTAVLHGYRTLDG
jgi:hypothetical protein